MLSTLGMRKMFNNMRIIIGGYANPFLIILLFIKLAILDVLGVGLVPILVESAIVSGGEHLKLGWFERLLPNIPGYEPFEILAGFVTLLFVLKSMLYVLANYLIYKFSYNVMHENRVELISLILKSKYQTIMRKSAADFINLLQLHINQAVSNYLIPCLKLVSDIIVCIFIMTYLMTFYPDVTLFVLSIIIVLSVLYTKLLIFHLMQNLNCDYKN